VRVEVLGVPTKFVPQGRSDPRPARPRRGGHRGDRPLVALSSALGARC
jgi:hypothetical protein